ncbi:unnamed protein product [Discosporangium mesarthrocarpum]
MSFTDMMQEAIKIRTETDAKLRVDFDARPKFQQSSLFAIDEVLEARKLPLDKRLAFSSQLKNKGNSQLRAGDVSEACHTYEQVSTAALKT